MKTTSISDFYRRITLALLALSLEPATHGQTDEELDVVALDPFQITGKDVTRGYGSINALGTRIKTDVSNLPQNVISLNEEFLKDIKPTTMADALRFVSGVSLTEGQYSGRLSLRGQQIEATGSRDGLGERLGASHGSVLPDPIEVQRLEVIKGPSGVLYGNHNFGGVINRVTKRPSEIKAVEIGGEYSMFSDNAYYRATLDATGPLDKEKKVLYRFLAAYQDGDNHMHDSYKRQTYIGEFRYRPNSATDVWARARYSDDAVMVQQDLWTDSEFNMPFNDVPRNPFIGNYFGDDQVDSTLARNIELGVSHRFYIGENRFDFRLLGDYSDVVAQRRTYIALGGLFYQNGSPLVVGEKTLTTRNATWAEARAAGYDDIRENIIRRDDRRGHSSGWGVNMDLKGSLNIGPTRHDLLIYGSKGDSNNWQRRFRENWVGEKPSIFEYTSIDPTTVLDGSPVTRANEWTSSDSASEVIAIADNIHLLEDKLILVGGYRYDTNDSQTFDFLENEYREPFEASNWTPGYGIVGKPREGVSLFYQHSETFRPQTGFNQSGDRLKPLIGDNDEFGVKLDLIDNRLIMTASVFDMLLENAPQKIILDDGSFFFEEVEDQVTEGWEIDLAAQPTDNFTFLFAIQDLDSVDLLRNRSIRNVPLGVTYKAVAKYAITEGPLQNFNFGINWEHINDSRFGDSANNFTLPGYDLYGLFMNYTKENYTVYLNIENVTDEWYVAGATNQLFMRSGAPRLFKIGFNYRLR